MTEDDDLQLRLHNALKQLMQLSGENVTLRAENALLRKKLQDQSNSEVRVNNSEPVFPHSSLSSESMIDASNGCLPAALSKPEKIEIFRSLFRGREDVYPSRALGESKNWQIGLLSSTEE